MCHFTIELQEAVRSQANFLELLENKTPALIRNFGADSTKVEEHLKTVTDYKIELINRERKLEKQVASNNGVNLAEPSKLALLVNEAIDNINALVKNGDIDNTLIAIATYIRDNNYSFNKQDSQVSDIVLSHFIIVFEKPVKVDNNVLNKDNNMYAEISRNIFNMIVSIDTKCSKVVNQEHGSKAYFIVDNVHLLKVDNYLSCTSQYYIQDINA